MNQILSDPTLWDASARGRAENRFHPRIVEIFYHDLTPEPVDFFAIRDGIIPLPASSDTDYRTVLLLGTTGVGKTTVVRQLLGTHPTEERFPSTSTAKTTIADTELLLDCDSYRVVVTFMPRDLARDYVEESLTEAVLSACRQESDTEILRSILNHPDQRFRLSYVLGRGESYAEESDEAKKPAPRQSDLVSAIDLRKTNCLLRRVVVEVQKIAVRTQDSLQSVFKASETDSRVVAEIMEENIDGLLREDEQFQDLVDEIMEEIELRFSALSGCGDLKKTKQGWPQWWRWQNGGRSAFLERVLRLSSNYPGDFGNLLTPLVNGIRVAGPFRPQWQEKQPQLALLDTEGLGHRGCPEFRWRLSDGSLSRFG